MFTSCGVVFVRMDRPELLWDGMIDPKGRMIRVIGKINPKPDHNQGMLSALEDKHNKYYFEEGTAYPIWAAWC